jgi:hypothetical protein
MNAVDLDRTRVLFPDTFGFARGKYVPIAEATGELNFSVTVFGIGYDRDLIPAPVPQFLRGWEISGRFTTPPLAAHLGRRGLES